MSNLGDIPKTGFLVSMLQCGDYHICHKYLYTLAVLNLTKSGSSGPKPVLGVPVCVTFTNKCDFSVRFEFRRAKFTVNILKGNFRAEIHCFVFNVTR